MHGAVIGVVGFQGGTQEVRDMLDSALAIKLSGAGFKIAVLQNLIRRKGKGLRCKHKAPDCQQRFHSAATVFARANAAFGAPIRKRLSAKDKTPPSDMINVPSQISKINGWW